jgi:asparagine synthase (glutamine-hydrolysing)
MCGIAGILHFDDRRPIDCSMLHRMTEVLAHRGPDGEGCYANGQVGFGHRRLAIIDLSTGAQPMVSGDLVIVFNGEIYNYIELKRELTSLGHSFATSSDTEVILRAYDEWGIDCQQRLNGMWAFALWDCRQRSLLLSRDRIGEKPLFFSVRDGALFFGSEIKSILATGLPYDRATNITHIYLSLGYVPAPYTFYSGISKLRPGHFLFVKDGDVRDGTYWDLPSITEQDMSADAQTICQQFDEYFADSVRIRMRSDVPFGAFLSGGLDSSSVVAAMSQESSRPVETFTIGFAEKAFDERALAREVADHFGTTHREHVASPATFDESLAKIRHHFDEPFGDASAIPVGMVSRLARENVTMVLTGDGGDEVLSGYTTYVAERLVERYRLVPGFLRSGLCQAMNGLAVIARGRLRYKVNRLRRFLHLSDTSFEDRFIAKLSLLDRRSIKDLISPDLPQVSIEEYLADVFSKCRFTDPFYRLMYFHLKVSLPDDMLAKVDRMSMSHSLEARVPFLDHRLIELTYCADKRVKMPDTTPKEILRRTRGRRLPESLLKAPKTPFSVPLREWFKRDDFDEKLRDLRRSDIGLDRNGIAEVITANQTGQHDYGDFIWRLFVLNHWATT